MVSAHLSVQVCVIFCSRSSVCHAHELYQTVRAYRQFIFVSSVLSSTPSLIRGRSIEDEGPSIEARKAEGRVFFLGRGQPAPSHQLEDLLGERCKFPQCQWDLRRSPSRNRIWCILAAKSDTRLQRFTFFCEN